jgi:hypothetical protein
MSLQYVMTLNGPRLVRKPGLLGVFDQVKSHPIMLFLGIGTGVALGYLRKKRRR